MQKKMTKAIGVFTLVLFVLSVTGAAATCSVCKAKPDTFNFKPTMKSGNVLKNDTGKGLKVISRSSCTNGGTVSMNSNGTFTYKAKSCAKSGTVRDSFTYKIKNSCGQTSTARVTINYKCH